MFFQVSWIRCHIVRIQGKKERKKKSRWNRWKSANFDNFWLRAVLFTPKVAFWKAWMKNKVFGNQIKEEKLEIFASVPYRSNTGKGKERIWERYRQKEEKLENLRDFQQIQVKFYQLFATVLRWSLEKFEEKIYKYIVRLTGGRRKERKRKA